MVEKIFLSLGLCILYLTSTEKTHFSTLVFCQNENMPLQEIDVEELYKKDAKLRKDDVKSLMDWAKMQPHLPKITELQTMLFLQSCYYSSEIAKNSIDTYFTVKTLCPDILGNRDPCSPSVQNAMNCVYWVYLPKLTPQGDRVILFKLKDTNPESYHFIPVLKYFDMITSVHLHKNGPDNGLIVVVDMKGMVFGHLLRFNALALKKFMCYFQEGLPIRLKTIHFVNVVPFVDKMLAMVKPFMKRELTDLLVVHDDMESLYKTIPKDNFPEDYGGSCESLETLLEKNKAVMNDSTSFYQFQESQVVDESKRPEKLKNVSDLFGIEGTFKKLDVD